MSTRAGRRRTSERLQQREEQQRQDNVEAGVKIGHGAPGIGLDRDERRADPIERRERQRTADDAVDQIADRQALGGGVAANTTFEQRVQRRPEIGPKHERERGVRRHDRLRRKKP